MTKTTRRQSSAGEQESASMLPQFEPRFPRAAAAGVCVLAAFTLLWPLLTGRILFGGMSSDMYIAGYSFRLFGAETFKATGAIPQWNPYLFGGLPYIAAMHGDIFYPTAWLRLIMPVDLAITWGMVAHLVLAGWLTYVFARALGLGWGAAVIAGVSYELSGIVASQMSPGHDGKLFVSALTPLAFWILLRAIRDDRRWAFGAFALVVALSVLGHYHMSYFLLIALGLWTLYLAFWDPGRRANGRPWLSVGLAAFAVVIGIGIASLQVIPFLQYIKYSPRADGGPATGWAFATSFAFPPRELFTLLLPEFNGILDHYWGQNPLKLHTEYVGVVPIALMTLAIGDKQRRPLVVALAVGAVVFLLFAFGGYSPLYRLLFNVLPYLNKIRAMGMVFFLVAFFLCLLAGIGMDRLLAGRVSPRTALLAGGCIVAFALLGAAGALQGLADSLATPERAAGAAANAPELRAGATRLLLFALAACVVLWAVAARRLRGALAAAIIGVVAVADLWSMDRKFYTFSPRANVLFRDDAITSYLRKVAPPYRVLDLGSYGRTSILMAYGIPSVFGYQGFNLRRYDELTDPSKDPPNFLSPSVLDLLSVRFFILGAPATIPGFHQVVAPTTTVVGLPGVLYERDTVPAYARVVLSAAKEADGADVDAIVNPRFPVNAVALFPDTSSVRADPLTRPLPLSRVDARVSRWAPGAMTISLAGADPRPGYLVISENWYPDWHASVDGKPAIVRRADHTLLGVDIPSGAREVKLWFDSPAYARGKVISAISLLIALVMMAAPFVLARRSDVDA